MKAELSPYNPHNKAISIDAVQGILTRFGVPGQVRNIQLYKRAFVHRSYTHEMYRHINVGPCPPDCPELRTKSYERLEFLGDGVLECVTKHYLYRRFPKEDEGFMTEKKISLVKNEHLGKLATAMNLPQWMLVSRSEEDNKIRMNTQKLGCLFEAFLGALFLDFNGIEVVDDAEMFRNFFHTGVGYQMSTVFLENIFNTIVNWNIIIYTTENYKSSLQVFVQKVWKTTPLYITLSSNEAYEVGVYLQLGSNTGVVLDPSNAIPYSNFGSVKRVNQQYLHAGDVFICLGTGTHRQKKKAEQEASRRAMTLFEDNAAQITTQPHRHKAHTALWSAYEPPP